MSSQEMDQITSTSPLILIGVSSRADRRRLTERDKVKMGECFRLGDIVKAKVVSGVGVAARRWSPASQLPRHANPLADVCKLSLGDARSYYLSTAANELGVVYATSESGAYASRLPRIDPSRRIPN